MEKTDLIWKGSASDLLLKLEDCTDEATYRSRYFPKAANMLKRQLNRLAPDLKALGIEVKEGIRSNNRESRPIVLEKVLKVSSTSSTDENKDPEPSMGIGKTVDDNDKKYRPLIVHSDESIVHSSSTDENAEISGRYLSSTNQVSSTYRPLDKTLQEASLSVVVDDVDDVDDKNKTFSGSEKINFKVGDRVKNERIDKVGTIRDIRTQKTPKGNEFIQYLVDFGFDSQWFEDVALTLEVAQWPINSDPTRKTYSIAPNNLGMLATYG